MSIEDKEIAEIFSGEEKPMHPDTVHVNLFSNINAEANIGRKRNVVVSKNETTTAKKDPHKPTHNFNGKSWEPIKERTWRDNVKDTAQWVIGFGGLSFLLFYWELAGLMAESIAVPCMCICTALAGWGVGKNVRCK